MDPRDPLPEVQALFTRLGERVSVRYRPMGRQPFVVVARGADGMGAAIRTVRAEMDWLPDFTMEDGNVGRFELTCRSGGKWTCRRINFVVGFERGDTLVDSWY